MMKPPVCVIGPYRSGTSLWASVVESLGADMGAPYWENSDTDSPQNHFESIEVLSFLQKTFNEPRMCRHDSKERTVTFLRKYKERRRSFFGVKHPLLSLCVDEIQEAWGRDTLFIVCLRDAQECSASAARAGFIWNRPETVHACHLLLAACQEAANKLTNKIIIEHSTLTKDLFHSITAELSAKVGSPALTRALTRYKEERRCVNSQSLLH